MYASPCLDVLRLHAPKLSNAAHTYVWYWYVYICVHHTTVRTIGLSTTNILQAEKPIAGPVSRFRNVFTWMWKWVKITIHIETYLHDIIVLLNKSSALFPLVLKQISLIALGPHLLAWIYDYKHGFLWDIIPHLCIPLWINNGWAIISCLFRRI